MKSSLFACLVVVSLGGATAFPAERSWELRGEFESLLPGAAETVVLRLADGRRLEVPLEALSDASRTAVRAAAAATTPSPVDGAGAGITVRGPFGRPVRLQVPEVIKDAETDAIHCRTAADAVEVYRLFLAGPGISPEQRGAAESRLREWQALADEDRVRLGDRWVPVAEARAAATEAASVVDHALELMRLGNAELAEEELRKAARIDPECSRASFVMGLSYALVARNPVKAIEHFGEAVSRSPGDAAALSNLAVLEVLARRYPGVPDHFREAVGNAADPAPITENVAWAVTLASAARVNPALARNKMPEKTVEELNAIYRMLTQELKLKPPDTVAAPQYLDPRGMRCTAASVADVARQCAETGAGPVERRRALGFVVAPGRVVCPRDVVIVGGTACEEIRVELPADRGRWVAATIIVAPEDGDVALLMCDELTAGPLALATSMPPQAEISAVDRPGASWFDVRPLAARGRVVTPASQVDALGRFIHTAALPRGPGGGPITDPSGRVVGMVAATPRTDASGNATGFGIPVERFLAGIRKHLPEDVAAPPDPDKDVASAERRAVAGTVLVEGMRGRSAAATQAPDVPR